MRSPNEEQKIGVEHNGNFLLQAGAGSGKTFVLIEHVVYKVKNFIYKNKKMSEKDFEEALKRYLSSVVIMTFTKKAVREIIERITQKSFEEAFIELVKIPLGLKEIEFYTKNINNLPQEVINHDSSKLPTIPTIFKLFSINKVPLISGTCITRSEDLAKFYNEVINNKNWISKSTRDEILKIHAKGLDYNDKMKFVKLGLGIRFDSDIFYEKETDSSDLSFGHTGMVSSIGWSSIEKNISVSICNNLLLSSALNRYRLNVISTAIKKDLNTI